MALIKCDECGKKVSDTCDTCPNCGADIQQQIYDSLSEEEKRAYDSEAYGTQKWLFIILTIFLVIVSIGTLFSAPFLSIFFIALTILCIRFAIKTFRK